MSTTHGPSSGQSTASATNRTRFTNLQVAQLFRTIGDMLQILGDSRFKITAYQNAARAIEELSQDINAVHTAGQLRSILGVGVAIAEKIAELLETGELRYYTRLAREVPQGVVEMMRVPDVGPKTARRLWQELGIVGIDAMQAAAEAGQIRALKGFGPKSEGKILKGIELLARRRSDRTPIGRARPLAQALVAALRAALPAGVLERIEVVGSLRRWRESIDDVDILAVSREPERVMAALRALPQVVDVLPSDERETGVALPGGLQVDLRVVEARHWGAALQYFTGSRPHNAALRELARRQGWSLNEYGLTAQGHPDVPDGETRTFEEEAALYEFLGLAWIPPQLREDRGEIAAAQAGQLPPLVALTDIQGELHGHSTWSDGVASIVDMAEAARRRGYRYWAVCDHSMGLGVTGGLDGERLRVQAAEIGEINRRYAAQGVDFRLLRGIEVEILADGSLGLPDQVLAELDVVVASIHSSLRQDRETITRRCLRAVHNPHVDILGHPTGRLLGQRLPSELDMEQVLRACAETGTVVELNANPARLDVNDVHARRAVELGCRIAVNSDAHAPGDMQLMEYGIATAQRGWLTAADVVNTRLLAEMCALLKDRSEY